MDESGLWTLFFATGLPEAYLALKGEGREEECAAQLPEKTAFQGSERIVYQI